MQKLICLSFLLFLTACGHQGSLHERVVAVAKSGNTMQAQQLAYAEKLYDDEASVVVRNMELGTLHYLNGEYYQALQCFDKANEFAKKLYAVSVSKSVASTIVGDGITDYAGEKYELSLLRFYLSLTHYQLYRQGFYEAYTLPDGTQHGKVDFDEAKKRMHYQAARAVIKDWDALLTTFTAESDSKNGFKQDILAKTYGAEMHSLFGTGADKQISRQLYKDVNRLLNSIYKDYPSLQGKNKKALSKFANERLKKIEAGKSDNVKVILKSGTVAAKKSQTYTQSIPLAAFLASGSGNSFVECLGMVLPGQTVSFEMPVIDKPAMPLEYKMEIQAENGKVIDKKFVLTAPISDTAYLEFKNNEATIKAKKFARITAKYVSAAVTACAIYQPDDFALLMSARASFALLSMGIAASEYADVRQWGLLPSNVYQQSVALKNGKYTLKVLEKDRIVADKSFEIKGSEPILLDVTDLSVEDK